MAGVPSSTSRRDWRWVAQLLSRDGNSLSVPLVDTLIMDKGRLSKLLHMSPSSGAVCCTPAPAVPCVFAAFRAISMGDGQSDGARFPAAVAHYAAGLPLLLDAGTFAAQAAAGFLIATAVQPYSWPRSTGQADVRAHASYRYEYRAAQSRDGVVFGPCWRYEPTLFEQHTAAEGSCSTGAALDAPARGVRLLPISHDEVSPSDLSRMAAVTRQLVSIVELEGRVAVNTLAAEFSVDHADVLWLVCTSDVQVAPAHEQNGPSIAVSHLTPQTAFACLTPDIASVGTKELHELKQLGTPAPGLVPVATALAQLVSGKPRNWDRVKDMLRGGGLDEFSHAMAQLRQHPAQVSVALLDALRPALTSEAFSDVSLRRTGELAERLGMWVRGVCEAALHSHGVRRFEELPLRHAVLAEAVATGARRLKLLLRGAQLLRGTKLSDGRGLSDLAMAQLPPELRPQAAPKAVLPPTAAITASLALGAAPATAGEPRSMKDSLAAKSSALQQLYGKGAATSGFSVATTTGTAGSTSRGESIKPRSELAVSGAAGTALAPAGGTGLPTAAPHTQPSKRSAPIVAPGVSSCSGTFKCADGVASLQWTVLKPADVAAAEATVKSRVDSGAAGKPIAAPRPALIVIPGLFDSREACMSLAVPSVQSGGDALIFSLPGQAGTSFAAPDFSHAPPPCHDDDGPSGGGHRATSPSRRRAMLDPRALNNEYLASCVHQLLSHLDFAGALPTASNLAGFSVAGLGRGGSVALCWAARYADRYRHPAGPAAGPVAASATRRASSATGVPSGARRASTGGGTSAPAGPVGGLSSLVIVNGFAHVDTQLRFVASGTRDIFRGYPPDRSDLARAYFQQFLAGGGGAEGSAGHDDAAPVAGAGAGFPASVQGATALLHGMLFDTDLRPLLSSSPLLRRTPLTLIRSTSDCFVSAGASEGALAGRDGASLTRTTGEGLGAGAHARPIGGSTAVVTLSGGHDVLAFSSALAVLQQLMSAACPGPGGRRDVTSAPAATAPGHLPQRPAELPLERSGPPSSTSPGCGGPSPGDDGDGGGVAAALDSASGRRGLVAGDLDVDDVGTGKEPLSDGYEGLTGLVLEQDDGLMDPPPEPEESADDARRREVFEAQFDVRLSLTKTEHAQQRALEAACSVAALGRTGAALRRTAIESVSAARSQVLDVLASTQWHSDWARMKNKQRAGAIKLKPLPFSDISAPALDFAVLLSDQTDGGIRTVATTSTTARLHASAATASGNALLLADADAQYEEMRASLMEHRTQLAASRAALTAAKHEARTDELRRMKDANAARIQAAWRGYAGRKLVLLLRIMVLVRLAETRVALALQRAFRRIRGLHARRQEWRRIHASRAIQRSTRRWLRYLHNLRARQLAAAVHMQRIGRGYIGRRIYRRRLAQRAAQQHREAQATRMQACWRGYAQRLAYEQARMEVLACTQVQRVFRGWRVRRRVAHKEALETLSRVKRVHARMADAAALSATMARSKTAMDTTIRALRRLEAERSELRARINSDRANLADVERELVKRGRLAQLSPELRAKRAKGLTKHLRRLKTKPPPSLADGLRDLQGACLSGDPCSLPAGLRSLLAGKTEAAASSNEEAGGLPVPEAPPSTPAPTPHASSHDIDAVAAAARIDSDVQQALTDRRAALQASLTAAQKRVSRISVQLEGLQLDLARHRAGLGNMHEQMSDLIRDQQYDLSHMMLSRPPKGPTIEDVQAQQTSVVETALVAKNTQFDRAEAAAAAQLQSHVLDAGVRAVAALSGLAALKQSQVDHVTSALGVAAAASLLGDMAPDRPLHGELSANVRPDLHHIVAGKLGYSLAHLARRPHSRAAGAIDSGATRPSTAATGHGAPDISVALTGLPVNIHPNVRPMGMAVPPPWASLSNAPQSHANNGKRGMKNSATASVPPRTLGSLPASQALALVHAATSAEEKRSYEITSAAALARLAAATEAAKPPPLVPTVVFQHAPGKRTRAQQLRLVTGVPKPRLHGDDPVLTVKGEITVRDVPAGSPAILPPPQQPRPAAAPTAAARAPSRGGPVTAADRQLRLIALRSRAGLRSRASGRGDDGIGADGGPLGRADLRSSSSQCTTDQPEDAGPAERDASAVRQQAATAASTVAPMPSFVRLYSVDHVCLWLARVGLGQYAALAREAGLDGELLLSVDARDLKVMGMADAGHVRRLIAEREGLRKEGNRNAGPSAAEAKLDSELQALFSTDAVIARTSAVLAHARAGRLVRVDEALRSGLPADAADADSGVTLLMEAVAGGHRRVIDLLLSRGAPINAADAHGHTALDALNGGARSSAAAAAVDADGALTRYLRARGACTSDELDEQTWQAERLAQQRRGSVSRVRSPTSQPQSRVGRSVSRSRGSQLARAGEAALLT